MTENELQVIHETLIREKERKQEIAIVKAQIEIEAIRRETDAYCNGVYDALRAVSVALPEGSKGE